MKKSMYAFVVMLMFSMFVLSCRDTKNADKSDDAIEMTDDVADDVEDVSDDVADDIEDAADDVEDALD